MVPRATLSAAQTIALAAQDSLYLLWSLTKLEPVDVFLRKHSIMSQSDLFVVANALANANELVRIENPQASVQIRTAMYILGLASWLPVEVKND